MQEVVSGSASPVKPPQLKLRNGVKLVRGLLNKLNYFDILQILTFLPKQGDYKDCRMFARVNCSLLLP